MRPVLLCRSRLFSGVSLLEVLISIVILALSMLAIANLLLVSSRTSSSSYIQQIAVQSAYNMFDKMRANPTAVKSGSYNVSNIGANGLPTSVAQPAVQCNRATCSPTQLAAYDTWLWMTNELAKLPNASGSIDTAAADNSGGRLVTVTVQWDDSPAGVLVGANNDTTTGQATSMARFIIQSIL
ncbi:MAG: type IV pilus modification protein PilV [Legionella sp.]